MTLRFFILFHFTNFGEYNLKYDKKLNWVNVLTTLDKRKSNLSST